MSFLSINSCLITDSIGNIYTFQYTQSGIEMITHEKATGNAEREVIVEGEILEYDVSISEEDKIYLVSQKKDSSISIYSINNNVWTESKLIDKTDLSIYNLKIVTHHDIVHIFYCKESQKDARKLNIYHHYFKGNKWETISVEEIIRNQIVNPIQILVNRSSLVLAYHDLGDYTEEVFIKKFDLDKRSWKDSVKITEDNKSKLYLDILELDNELHITYSEYEYENLTVKHKKISLDSGNVEKMSENILSNQANCTYPTLIYQNNLLWCVWTEYENVVSSYSEDRGITWSNAYSWKDSKGVDFVRYKFDTNQDSLKENYTMNYSFGKTYPNLGFLGFGNLEKAVEVPKKKDGSTKENPVDKGKFISQGELIKRKYYENYDYLKEKDVTEMNSIKDLSYEISKLEKILDDIEIRISSLEADIKKVDTISLEDRVIQIEEYLKRRRNPFGSRV